MTAREIDDLRAGDKLFSVEEHTNPDGSIERRTCEYRMRSPRVTKHQKARYAMTIRIESYRPGLVGAARGRIRLVSTPLLQSRFERTERLAVDEFRARVEREVERERASLEHREQDARAAIAWANDQRSE